MSAATPPLGRRVLVVDDHRDCRELFAEVASDAGCEVRTAGNGAEALAIARQFMPHLVLLDLGLPDMSGYDVAATLRGDEATADAIIAAVTGYGAGSDRERAASAGIDVFFVKPLTWSDLLTVLSSRRAAN